MLVIMSINLIQISKMFLETIVFDYYLGNSFFSFNFYYIFFADLFILSWIWLWLGIFRTQIGEWKIWAFLSTASFFAYLYHRPLWYFFNQMFGFEDMQKVYFNLFIGSVTAIVLGYFLQRGYDKLLAVLHLK